MHSWIVEYTIQESMMVIYENSWAWVVAERTDQSISQYNKMHSWIHYTRKLFGIATKNSENQAQ